MAERVKLLVDFNYGGLVGDDGRVYLTPEQVERDLHAAGVELRVGVPVSAFDYDGDTEGPAWLVVDGELGYQPDTGRWYVDYTRSDLRWLPRGEGETAPT